MFSYLDRFFIYNQPCEQYLFLEKGTTDLLKIMNNMVGIDATGKPRTYNYNQINMILDNFIKLMNSYKISYNLLREQQLFFLLKHRTIKSAFFMIL
jgi:hypothetical protein